MAMESQYINIGSLSGWRSRRYSLSTRIMQQAIHNAPSSRPVHVLPPITSTCMPSDAPNLDRDNNFIKSLKHIVSKEMETFEYHIDEGLYKQRYSVFKDAFSQLVQYLSGYRPLLTAIKAEFEDCIQTIERGKQEAFYLSGKVKSMVAEQTTLSYYIKRAAELQEILSVIESDNEQIRMKIKTLQGEHNSRLQAAQDEIIPVKLKKPHKHDKPEGLLPGFTLGESIDIEYLHKQSTYLEQHIKDLNHAKKIRYTSREQKNQLKNQLASKSKAKDHVTERNMQLKARCRKLRVALDAFKMYAKDPPLGHTPAEAIMHALTRSNSKMSSRSGDITSAFDDDDPSKEREAEMLLEYIEHFNELFEDGNYNDAAMHAANSPKGILRNSETLSRFRAIHVKFGKISPLLGYCEAIMSSVPAVGTLPNAETSLECVKSALMEDRLDLVMYWLAQKRLTCSEPLGHLLYNYTHRKSSEVTGRCLPLAEAVYTTVGAHIQAAVCMCKQGKVQAMMEYADSAEFGQDMFVGVLVACPSIALAEVLIQPTVPTGKPALSVGTVVAELLQTENHDIGVQLLDKLYHNMKSGASSACVKDLVFCDPETDCDAWMQIVTRCQDSGLCEMALEILAAVTVLQAIKKASFTMSV